MKMNLAAWLSLAAMMGAQSLSLLNATPARADGVREHFAAPRADAAGFVFRAFAIRPDDGGEWKIRIRFIGNAGVLEGFVDMDIASASKLLLEGSKAMGMDEVAAASPADIYEYRVAVNSDLEFRYMVDKIAKEKVVYFKGKNIVYKNHLDPFGNELGSPFPKEAFQAMLNTLKQALDKAQT